MKVEQSEAVRGICIYAEDEQEVALLDAIATILNSHDSKAPARLFDNVGGFPERLINGILEITPDGGE